MVRKNTKIFAWSKNRHKDGADILLPARRVNSGLKAQTMGLLRGSNPIRLTVLAVKSEEYNTTPFKTRTKLGEFWTVKISWQ